MDPMTYISLSEKTIAHYILHSTYMYCVHVCVCVCVCVHVRVCVCACMCVCMYACMYVHMHICMHVCACACMCACMYVRVCCVCVCMYACMHVRTCIWQLDVIDAKADISLSPLIVLLGEATYSSSQSSRSVDLTRCDHMIDDWIYNGSFKRWRTDRSKGWGSLQHMSTIGILTIDRIRILERFGMQSSEVFAFLTLLPRTEMVCT
jgi:hypothetical protein